MGNGRRDQTKQRNGLKTSEPEGKSFSARSRRARRKQRLRADKDHNNRFSQWRRKARTDPLRGVRTQAAFAATGVEAEPTGNLRLQTWLAAIPLDVYWAVLRDQTWQKDWQIVPPNHPSAPDSEKSDPGEQLVAYAVPSKETQSNLCLRFLPEEGGTRLELLQSGLRPERIPTTIQIWQRVLLGPLALHFAH